MDRSKIGKLRQGQTLYAVSDNHVQEWFFLERAVKEHGMWSVRVRYRNIVSNGIEVLDQESQETWILMNDEHYNPGFYTTSRKKAISKAKLNWVIAGKPKSVKFFITAKTPEDQAKLEAYLDSFKK